MPENRFSESLADRNTRLAEQREVLQTWRLLGTSVCSPTVQHQLVVQTVYRQWAYFGPLLDVAARHLATASAAANEAYLVAFRACLDQAAWERAGGPLTRRRCDRLERLSWVAALLAGHMVGERHVLDGDSLVTVAEFGEVLAQLIEGAP